MDCEFTLQHTKIVCGIDLGYVQETWQITNISGLTGHCDNKWRQFLYDYFSLEL